MNLCSMVIFVFMLSILFFPCILFLTYLIVSSLRFLCAATVALTAVMLILSRCRWMRKTHLFLFRLSWEEDPLGQ